MDNEIMKLLGEEIKSEIDGLSSLEPGSEEHSTAVESLTKLYKLRIEEMKNTNEYNEKCERRKMEEQQHKIDAELKEKQINDDAEIRGCEEELKREQLVEEIKNRYLKLGVEAAGIILPLLFYSSWMKKGFRFEETGTFTSTTFRGLFSRFRPTKK